MVEFAARPRKTVTRAIRIEDSLDKALGEISLKEGTSVNFIVNRALQKFVEWDYLAGKYGVTASFTSELTKLIDYLSDEEIIEFARWVAKNLFKEYVTFWFKSVDLENIIKAIRLLSVAGNFRYDESFNSEVRSIVCKHNSGRKWSKFYAEVFTLVFQDLGETQVKVESTENQVLVQFEISKRAYLEPFYETLQKQRSLH